MRMQWTHALALITVACGLATGELSTARAALVVTNGDIELPSVGAAGQQAIAPTGWFRSAGESWQAGVEGANHGRPDVALGAFVSGGTGYVNSQHLLLGNVPNEAGTFFFYQLLGTTEAGDGVLNYSIYQGRLTDGLRSDGGFNISFFAGNNVFAGADGIDVATQGLTQIGATHHYAALSQTAGSLMGRINTDSVSISSLSSGTQVWMRLALADAAGFLLLDNVSVSVAPIPEPASFALIGLGCLGLLGVARRRTP